MTKFVLGSVVTYADFLKSTNGESCCWFSGLPSQSVERGVLLLPSAPSEGFIVRSEVYNASPNRG